MKKQEFKVKATLQKKNNFWYVVCDYKDGDGKRKQPWLKTGIPVKTGSDREKNKLAPLLEEKRKELELHCIHHRTFYLLIMRNNGLMIMLFDTLK